MGTFDQLRNHLQRFEFDRVFVEVLGWSKFKHLSRIELPDIGRLPRGWKTRNTRALIRSAPRIYFTVRGVATLGPQVVLHCTSERGTHIDGLRRDRLARELSKLFYRPIIIFSSTELYAQDWYFPSREDESLAIVKFSADSKNAVEHLADALLTLELTAENLILLDDHLEVFNRVRALRDELNDENQRDEELRFALKFAEFGDAVFEAAKKAYRLRIWDIQHQSEIGRKAKAGDADAIQTFFDMHQYLVFERSREYLKAKKIFISDFDDYIGCGNIGIARGLARYEPERGYAPSTLVFYHIDKQIGRAFGLLELPMWIPVHVQSELLKACWEENAMFDKLCQQEQRLPGDRKLMEVVGLDDDDYEVYGRFKLSRLWKNRVEWESIANNEQLEERLSYREDYDQRQDDVLMEAMFKLKALPKRQRDILALRTGIHPAANGEQLTLEEVSQIFGVTRERARQLLLKAVTAAKKTEVIFVNPVIEHTTARQQTVFIRLEKTIHSRFPLPTLRTRSANAYVELILEKLGAEVNAQEVHKIMLIHFPNSSLKVERIQRKLEVLRERQSTISACQLPDRTMELETEVVHSEETNNEEPEKQSFEITLPPAPTVNIRKGNEYIEQTLDVHGSKYSALTLYQSLRKYFPQSIITEAQIRDKMKRRGLA